MAALATTGASGLTLAFAGVSLPPAPIYDPDAQTFIDAVAPLANDWTVEIEEAIDDFVIGLKDDGLWNLLDIIYPFVGGTAAAHARNLKNPADTNAAHRVTWIGVAGHSANGVAGGGANVAGNTHYKPSQGKPRTAFAYIQQTVAALYIDMGLYNGGQRWELFSNFANTTYYDCWSTSEPQRFTASMNPSNGFIVATRLDGTPNDTVRIAREGVILHTETISVETVLPDIDAYILAGNDINTGAMLGAGSNRSYGLMGLSATGLDATEIVNLSARVSTLQTNLGREI